jgi:ribosomal protein S12 methylthiotransferase accessory factor YcaO
MLKLKDLSLVLMALTLLPAAAQTANTPNKPAGTAQAKPAPKPAPKAQPAQSKQAAPAAAQGGAAAAAAALTPGQMEAAERVFTGTAQCEFGEKIQVTADDRKPGHFVLKHGKSTYNLVPETTTTGAVRLEDKPKGIMWLQIPSKSMLMNSKIGQRMVDNCLMSQQTG